MLMGDCCFPLEHMCQLPECASPQYSGPTKRKWKVDTRRHDILDYLLILAWVGPDLKPDTSKILT